jgi:porin
MDATMPARFRPLYWSIPKVIFLVIPIVGSAADRVEVAPPQDVPYTLTGEWFGARTWLRDAGINLTGNYVSELATNLAGGVERDVEETGMFVFGATLDLDRLFSLEGGRIQFSITDRRGTDLNQAAQLNTIQDVQEVFGRGKVWRLTELWYQQALTEALDVRFGRMPQGTDFATFSCDFQNLAFCGSPGGSIAGDYWFNWPVSVSGVRLRLQYDTWYAMVGAYASNPNDLEEDFTIGHGGTTGVMAPIEFAWTPRLGADQLPGKYRVGTWYNSSRVDDVLLGADHLLTAVTGKPPLRRDGRYAGYMMLQQQLFGTYQDDPLHGPQITRGLSVFFNVTQTDHFTERTDNEIAVGLFYTGLLQGRPRDDLGLAFARTQVNGRARLNDMLANPGIHLASAEYEAELYYSLHFAWGVTVRPNLQYVANPNGLADSRNVIAFGIKSAVTF